MGLWITAAEGGGSGTLPCMTPRPRIKPHLRPLRRGKAAVQFGLDPGPGAVVPRADRARGRPRPRARRHPDPSRAGHLPPGRPSTARRHPPLLGGAHLPSRAPSTGPIWRSYPALAAGDLGVDAHALGMVYAEGIDGLHHVAERAHSCVLVDGTGLPPHRRHGAAGRRRRDRPVGESSVDEVDPRPAFRPPSAAPQHHPRLRHPTASNVLTPDRATPVAAPRCRPPARGCRTPSGHRRPTHGHLGGRPCVSLSTPARADCDPLWPALVAQSHAPWPRPATTPGRRRPTQTETSLTHLVAGWSRWSPSPISTASPRRPVWRWRSVPRGLTSRNVAGHGTRTARRTARPRRPPERRSTIAATSTAAPTPRRHTHRRVHQEGTQWRSERHPRKAVTRRPAGRAARRVCRSRGLGLGRRVGAHRPRRSLRSLQARTAQQLFATLGEFQAGGAMKFGQAMSIFESALPEEIAGPYRATSPVLQDSAPPLPLTESTPCSPKKAGPAVAAPVRLLRRHSGRRRVDRSGPPRGMARRARRRRQGPVPGRREGAHGRPPADQPSRPGRDLVDPRHRGQAHPDELRERMKEGSTTGSRPTTRRSSRPPTTAIRRSTSPCRPRHRARPRQRVARRRPALQGDRLRQQGRARPGGGEVHGLPPSGPGRAGVLHADPHPGNFRMTPRDGSA